LAQKNFLIAGLSGAGKTTLHNYLSEIGYSSYDADKEFGEHIDHLTGLPDPHNKQENWVWNKHKLRAVLDNQDSKHTFICGGANNQHGFRSSFDEAFFLVANNQILEERMTQRTSKPTPEELIQQREWNNDWSDLVEEQQMVAIGANRSTVAIAADILAITTVANDEVPASV
jgi:shikimate kinase